MINKLKYWIQDRKRITNYITRMERLISALHLKLEEREEFIGYLEDSRRASHKDYIKEMERADRLQAEIDRFDGD